MINSARNKKSNADLAGLYKDLKVIDVHNHNHLDSVSLDISVHNLKILFYGGYWSLLDSDKVQINAVVFMYREAGFFIVVYVDDA